MAGCLDPLGGSDPYGGLPADQRPAETFGPDEVQRRVGLAGVDSLPGDLDVSIDVILLEDTIMGNHTARMRVATTNEGSNRFFSVAEGGCSLFNRTRGESEDEALWLIGPDFPGMNYLGEEPRRVAPLWAIRRDGDGPPPGLVFLSYGCGLRRYGPGETVANEYLLWDGWHGPGYIPPGVHRFEAEVEVTEVQWSSGEGPPTPGETIATAIWGFELSVEAPRSGDA